MHHLYEMPDEEITEFLNSYASIQAATLGNNGNQVENGRVRTSPSVSSQTSSVKSSPRKPSSWLRWHSEYASNGKMLCPPDVALSVKRSPKKSTLSPTAEGLQQLGVHPLTVKTAVYIQRILTVCLLLGCLHQLHFFLIVRSVKSCANLYIPVQFGFQIVGRLHSRNNTKTTPL